MNLPDSFTAASECILQFINTVISGSSQSAARSTDEHINDLYVNEHTKHKTLMQQNICRADGECVTLG